MEGIKKTSKGDMMSIWDNSANEAFEGEKFSSNEGKMIFWFLKEMLLLGFERTGGLQKTEMGETNIFKWDNDKNEYLWCVQKCIGRVQERASRLV